MDQPAAKTLKRLKPLAGKVSEGHCDGELAPDSNADSSEDERKPGNRRRTRTKAAAAAGSKERQRHKAATNRVVSEAAARAKPDNSPTRLLGQAKQPAPRLAEEAAQLTLAATGGGSLDHSGDANDALPPALQRPSLCLTPYHVNSRPTSTAQALRTRPLKGQASSSAAANLAAVDNLLGSLRKKRK